MEKSKKVVARMGIKEVIDYIPRLLNLMTLADVIPDGTTVYDTDTGDMLELVPMIREAKSDLQWLLDRAGVVDDSGEAKEEEKDDTDDKRHFVGEFVRRKRDMGVVHDVCEKRASEATKEFATWLGQTIMSGVISDDEFDEFMRYSGDGVSDADKVLVATVRLGTGFFKVIAM